MPPVAIALAIGLGLLALGMGAKGQEAKPSTGPKPLDAGMPPELDAQVRQLLKTSTRPDDLESLAVITDARGYHNTAAALRARASQLRGQISVPSVPVPSATPSTAPSTSVWPTPPGLPEGIPIPLPVEPSSPAPYPAPAPVTLPRMPPVPVPAPAPLPPEASIPIPVSAPTAVPPMPPVPVSAPMPATLPPMPPAPAPPPIEDIDPNIPPDLAQSVAAILAKPDLTDQELAFAEQLANRCEQEGFVRAAAKLRAKTLAIRASHAGSTLLQQIATVITAPPGSLPSLPVNSPVFLPSRRHRDRWRFPSLSRHP
ncbi:MAG TPA: hypothetical protein VJT73_09355 [Polyangiaceae bacterium]|nr:hypothetical protein [Polyangiaceae bacterium]